MLYLKVQFQVKLYSNFRVDCNFIQELFKLNLERLSTGTPKCIQLSKQMNDSSYNKQKLKWIRGTMPTPSGRGRAKRHPSSKTMNRQHDIPKTSLWQWMRTPRYTIAARRSCVRFGGHTHSSTEDLKSYKRLLGHAQDRDCDGFA